MLALTIATWVLSGALALMFLMAGTFKLVKPLADLPMPTLHAHTPATVKLIGIAEVLGAIGVIVPQAFGILPILAPLAALGLALIQVLAVFAHRKLDEPFSKNIVLALLAIAVAVLTWVTL